MGSPLGPTTFFPYPAQPVGSPDSIFLSGFVLPGKWTLLSADKIYGWQINQATGLSGATVSPKGDPLVVARFKCEIWDEIDMSLFKTFRKQFFSKGSFSLPGGLFTAGMGISHPELKALGVTTVVVQKVAPLIDEGGGLWVTEVEFLEYRPPVKVQKKPTQKTPDVGPPIILPRNQQEVEEQKLKAEVLARQK